MGLGLERGLGTGLEAVAFVARVAVVVVAVEVEPFALAFVVALVVPAGFPAVVTGAEG